MLPAQLRFSASEGLGTLSEFAGAAVVALAEGVALAEPPELGVATADVVADLVDQVGGRDELWGTHGMNPSANPGQGLPARNLDHPRVPDVTAGVAWSAGKESSPGSSAR